MLRSSTTIAGLVAALGLSSVAGFALAYGHGAIRQDTTLRPDTVALQDAEPVARPAVRQSQVADMTTLVQMPGAAADVQAGDDGRLAQTNDAPAAFALPAITSDAPGARRPAPRPQVTVAAKPVPMTNQPGLTPAPPPASAFSYSPLVGAAPLAAAPRARTGDPDLLRPVNKMPNLDSAWKSGVYR